MGIFFRFAEPIDARRRRKGWFVLIVFAAFVLGCFILPASPLAGVVLCPFRRLTGLSCPGCGMTRACVHLFHGDLAGSLRFHPFGWLFVLVFLLVAINRLVENLSGRRVHYPGSGWWQVHKNRVATACLVALVVFGATRFFMELTGFLTPV